MQTYAVVCLLSKGINFSNGHLARRIQDIIREEDVRQFTEVHSNFLAMSSLTRINQTYTYSDLKKEKDHTHLNISSKITRAWKLTESGKVPFTLIYYGVSFWLSPTEHTL